MNRLDALLACPTAPFHEHAISGVIEGYAERHGLVLLRDTHHNLVMIYDGGGQSTEALALCLQAPMDQPGFEVVDLETAPDGTEVATARWSGESPGPLSPGQAVAVLTRRGVVGGQILEVQTGVGGECWPEFVRLSTVEPVRVGDPGLLDGPLGQREGEWIVSRAARGTVPVAVLLEVFDRLMARQPPCRVTAVFTRAASARAVGAVALHQSGLLLPDQPVIAVSAAPTPPGTSPGMGPVLRVSDAHGLLDAGLLDHVADCADTLARQSDAHDWQQALMPESPSEAGVFQALGHPTASLVLALHHEPGNTDDRYSCLGPPPPFAGAPRTLERVHLGDVHALVDLLELVAIGWAGPITLERRAQQRAQRIKKGTTRLMPRLRL